MSADHTINPGTRRPDGQPETEADTRFFDERESGYTGPLDEDGHRALTDPQVEILEHLGRINQQGGTS